MLDEEKLTQIAAIFNNPTVDPVDEIQTFISDIIDEKDLILNEKDLVISKLEKELHWFKEQFK